MIEIRHLKLIHTVAKVGTLKKAAEKLFLTQSALSHQLKELESRLDTKIFHRINNQLMFTDAGRELLNASEDILVRLEKAQDNIREINQDRMKNYIHGYSHEETTRLNDQAGTIAELLHWDSFWEKGSLILEAGCGVGAQTKIISKNNPDSSFISVDISSISLEQAKKIIHETDVKNVEFVLADILDLPFDDGYFDHIFVCFVLEHLSEPAKALKELKRVLKPKGSLMVIEGDHGSTYFYPDSVSAQNAVQAQVLLQQQKGGNANIGRELYPLLYAHGFENIVVSPRQVYVDDSKPDLVEGFIKNTFTAMIKGVSEEALINKIISKVDMDRGIDDLFKTAKGGGTFCYTFFKAIAVKADILNKDD
ncbi:methyltransferase domain-containing protein [Aquimarina celericrescens]|uniref:Methyltransferase domain-containing protein n=1 Tax=Aquimarina celericrescens TaxID=1964542 RepID=A0ABW5AWF4_9FLAO|nr:methyltransferase domain-containing protein [Aquimarina celericrescens]